MPKSPIEARLAEFRRRVRQVIGLHGTCWLLVVVTGIAAASGVVDWLLDLSTGVRAILLATLIGAAAWTAWRLLVLPYLARLRDVDLAMKVEAEYPKLHDQLASAVEFLEESPDSARSGSPALKRAVVEQTSRQVSSIRFESALDWRPTKRAAAVATTVLVLAAVLVFASPGSARIALARLINPFGRTGWPRDTHLALGRVPTRIARGEPFPFTVQVVQGRMPDRAEVHFAFEGGDFSNESLRPQGDRQFAGGLEAATRSFDFYVRAGDGLTDPVHVDVVPPPEIERLKVTLTFPPYTDLPVEELPDDKGQVRAVWGTQVDVAARASKPLDSAAIRIGQNEPLNATLSLDGRDLRASFKIEENGSYWLALRDREGFENRQATRYELTVRTDQAPDVFIERPVSDIQVTPTADVPLRVMLKDDFGIDDATLVHSGSAPDAPPEATVDVPLWKSGAEPECRHVIEHTWRLAELGLTPGSMLTYRVTARDRDNLRGPNVGQSRQLRLHVVAADELARSLEDRQQKIYQDLERLRKLQVDARQQVVDLREQLKHQPALSKADLTRLQAAEMLQRQIERKIASPTEGLQNNIEQIKQDLANNHITNSAVSEQMEAVGEGLDKIAREALPEIEQNLSRVRKGAEESADKKPQETGLGQAQKHQDHVVATLDELLEQMSKWETYRGIAREVRDLAEQQEQLATDTRDTGRETIGKQRESLPADQQAKLGQLANRQDQLREQLNRVQRKMEQMSGRVAENDPIGAETLRDAVEGSRQAGTSEQMQKASSSIQQNQVGAAETAQKQSAEDLKNMLDTLENTRERDLAKIVQKLKEAEQKLSDLRKRQVEQLERTKEAQSQADAEARKRELEKLAREEKELQQETARLAQQLRRLRAERAGKTSSSAAGRMGQAGQQMQQGEGEQAQQEQEKVLEELQQAQRETEQARKEAEAELAMEQLVKIADTLAALHQREVELKKETVRLDTARRERGDWTRPQLASLRAAAENQKQVREETEKAKEVLTSAPVFALTLTRAISNMDRAGERLGERLADDETQAAEQAAIDRFAQLLDALKNDPSKNVEGEQQEGGGQGGGQQGGPPRDGIPPLAQLKLLRSLQVEINQRTTELAELQNKVQKLTPAQQNELKSLAAEQGTLADLVREFIQSLDEGENQ
jgi:hypothetical protein